MMSTIRELVLRDSEFRKFREIIYRQSGISLDDGKKTFLQSRLQKRLRALGLETYAEYFDVIKNEDSDGDEMQQMINRVTTNKTHFFREEHHFAYLQEVVFPSLIQSAERGERPKRLRIWSAACSSGEEPYSLAMTVQETFSSQPGWDIRILASDIDTNVLTKAKSGIYHKESVEELDLQRVQQHFLKGRQTNLAQVQVRKEIRELVAFRRINFADSYWPIQTKFDAIFCRNALIYFDEATQDRLVCRLAEFLRPDGCLFIGHSESLARVRETYTRVGPTVFKRTESAPQEPNPVLRSKQKGSDTKAPVSRPPVSPPQVCQPQYLARTPAKATRETASAGNPSETDSNVQRIIVGDVFTSESPMIVTTTLGSCIATCLYDEVTRIGGMNHFALPVDKGSARLQTSFGVHAMELLINEILTLGGAKRRLKAKVFGAATLTSSENANSVASINEAFIRQFLETEGIPLEAALLGGNTGMQVLFETSTGRARVKMLDKEATLVVDKQSQPIETPASNITLF